MTEKKLTKRDVLNYMIETYSNDEKVVEYATHEIELLDKKASYKGETKVQKENVAIMETIVETLGELAKPSRIADIQGANETLSTLSNQKMSALLKKLVDNKTIVKTTDKKITYFSIAE